MKSFAQLLLIYFLLLVPAFAGAQVTEMPLMPASGIASYGNYPISQLNRAHRQQLTGQFEVALMTYTSALTFQPNWVPALTARAELLYRLGRQLEAKKDHNSAMRANATATAFYMSRGHNGLLPFLALYPKQWFQDQYGFVAEELPYRQRTQLPYDHFEEQYKQINSALDTALVVQVLKQKVGQNIIASKGLLEQMPRNYNPAVRRMLEANLAMLNHDYREAVNLYADVENKFGVDWPELKYNRGLGSLLLHDYMNGCSDLAKASEQGFAPATIMFDCLCNM